ncbi:uncharacterized protein LOC110853180 [Folsomia candida]|uniref:uncharacterized protein LOC110853180 n=1 Tax=Folsomia candida TaxID=158441 RepID=UPI0016053292|nr:uncharacterized protein LOC110853180 [Folsomia candida]
MYTTRLFRLLHLMCKLTTKMGSFSMHFNPTEKIFYITTRSRRKYGRSIVILISYMCLMWRQVMYIYLDGDDSWTSNSHFHFGYVLTFGVSVPIVASMILYLEQNNVSRALNLIFGYFPRFHKKWMPICHPETNPILKLLVILVHLEIAGFALIPFATTFYFITSPENGVHPRQVFLPACVKNDPVFVSASLLGVTIIAGMTWYLVMLCVVIATLYFFSMQLVLREFDMKGNTKHLAFDSLRESGENLSLEYTCIRLVHKALMDPFGLLIVFSHGACSHFILFCNFTIIKNWHTTDIFNTVLLLLWVSTVHNLWSTVLEVGGRFQKMSASMLKSWKLAKFSSNEERKFVAKFRKWQKRLAFGKDGVFIITRISILKFFRANLKGTFKAVLTIE